MKRCLDGYGIVRYSDITAAVNVRKPMEKFDAMPNVDVLFSLSGSNAKEGDWRRPEYYDLSLRFSENGKLMKASYYHQMKFHELWKKNQVHNVVLGGEFTHDETSGNFENYLTVGGAWQLSRNAIVKARANTKGDFNATVGGTLPLIFPSITTAATVKVNAFGSDARFGFSIIVEDI